MRKAAAKFKAPNDRRVAVITTIIITLKLVMESIRGLNCVQLMFSFDSLTGKQNVLNT